METIKKKIAARLVSRVDVGNHDSKKPNND